jgi:hypothetical protein
MMQDWTVVTKEGCEPAQVAAVSNAPTMWTHGRDSWWPGGIATWADGLLNDESSKRSLDIWEQETRALPLNYMHAHTLQLHKLDTEEIMIA